MNLNLNTDIIEINQVGKTIATRFKKLGIKKAPDALFYFPFRYDDFSTSTPISEVKAESEINIIGHIELIQNKKSRTKKLNITEALIADSSGEIKVIWFNQPFLTKNLKVGDKVSLAGKAKLNLGDELILNSPVYEKISSSTGPIHTLGLIPNYHSTEKLTQKQIRFVIKKVLPLASQVPDWLPNSIKTKHKLLNLSSALHQIHFPDCKEKLDQARKRLAFNELFLLQLKAQVIRAEIKNQRASSIKFLKTETKNFISSLPFSPTYAQKKSAWEIIQDLEKETPMARLLEGDVGSGKTLVAAIAMLNVALDKDFKQSGLMVPTEILAEQHFNSLSQLFKQSAIKIGLLTKDKRKINFTDKNWEKQTSKKKQATFITSFCQIVIGTHSLIQAEITFSNLVLAIIDEQHRFGVEQRKALTQKSGNQKTIPHFLSMTATPIPRTLALGLFGDLDISIIDELPSQRKKIITKIVPENKRNQAYKFTKEQLKAGRQAFVVCPLIDPSDKLGVKSSKEEHKKLQNFIFPDKKIGLMHGQMKSQEKETIMKDFLDQKINILVSTSVVEVGVDVPNATIMMVEGADRFGLAQLHQFRGRIGRGIHQSYCFLFTESNKEITQNRLKALEKHHDGFTLAKIDLKSRGSGEIYGTVQKGFPELKIATLWDYELMTLAQTEAKELIKIDPELKNQIGLKNKLNQEKEKIHLE